MFGPHEEGAFLVEGFGPAGDGAVADADGDATSEGGAAAHPFVADLVEIAGVESGVEMVEFAEDGGGEGRPVEVATGLGTEGGGDVADIGREGVGVEVYIDPDAQDGVADAVEFSVEFEEDAGGLAMAEEDVVGPFDFGVEPSFAFDGAGDGDGGNHGELGGGGGSEVGSEENREPQPATGGRTPGATEPAPSAGLGFCKDHTAFSDSIAGELLDDVVGGGGFGEDNDVAADDPVDGQPGHQVVAMEGIGCGTEDVAVVWAGFDVIAGLAEFLDAVPDRGATDAELPGEDGTGRAGLPGIAQGAEDLGVGVHAKSSARSTERAEWVSAPTEMKSTPARAMSRTVSRRTPPEASVRERPAISWMDSRS